jgi:hypothetical protein
MTIAGVLGCASATNVRDKDDFYETPTDATVALCLSEIGRIPDKLWDPADGHGKLSNVLKTMLFSEVICSDRENRGIAGQIQ